MRSLYRVRIFGIKLKKLYSPAALSSLLPVVLFPPEVDFLFLSSGSFLIFLMIPVDEEARFINLFCRGAVFRLTGLSDLSAGLFRRGIPSGVEDLDLDLERDLEDLKNRTKFRSLSLWWEDIFGVGGCNKKNWQV